MHRTKSEGENINVWISCILIILIMGLCIWVYTLKQSTPITGNQEVPAPQSFSMNEREAMAEVQKLIHVKDAKTGLCYAYIGGRLFSNPCVGSMNYLISK